jgi:4-hydroxy-2-oxoheptanedioate aldolase
MAYVFQGFGSADRPKTPRLAEKLAKGGTVIGAACYLGSAIIAEMLAQLPLDFIYVDQQHGLSSPDGLVGIIRAVDRSPVSPIVRVRSNDSGLIGQALDAGADGVIVPMVNTRHDAEKAVASCLYSPSGCRSFGPIRASLKAGYGTLEEINRSISCFVMIETREGLANLTDIAAVPGLAGIYIGQADLAVSLGLEPELRIQDGEHAQAIDAILAACANNNIAAGLSGDPNAMASRGFRMITAGSDQGFIAAGVEKVGQLLAANRHAGGKNEQNHPDS